MWYPKTFQITNMIYQMKPAKEDIHFMNGVMFIVLFQWDIILISSSSYQEIIYSYRSEKKTISKFHLTPFSIEIKVQTRFVSKETSKDITHRTETVGAIIGY